MPSAARTILIRKSSDKGFAVRAGLLCQSALESDPLLASRYERRLTFWLSGRRFHVCDLRGSNVTRSLTFVPSVRSVDVVASFATISL
jgi:hypothetical protein